MWFLSKVLFSALIIAFASWLSGRKPILAGFIIALPLMSMLAILFSYIEFKDMNRIDQFARSILVATPLSLSFFMPFLLGRWVKMSFTTTYVLAVLFVIAAFFIHGLIAKGMMSR